MSLRIFPHFFSTYVPCLIFLFNLMSSVPILANGTEGYIIKGTKVEYHSIDEAGKPARRKLQGVQTNYFRILPTPDKPAGPFEYGKDLKSVYYKGIRIEDADPISFEVLSSGYAKDERSVYYFGSILPEASPAAFGVLGWSWAKDSLRVYKDGQEVAFVAEPASFQLLSPYVAKDARHVYLYKSVFKEADPASFTLISSVTVSGNDTIHYYKDQNKVFLGELVQDTFVLKTIEGADVSTFEVLKGLGYAKDNQQVYYKTHVLAGADPEGFRVLPDGYSKDQRRIYYLGKLLNKAHAPTFLVIRNKYGASLASDEYSVYFEDQRIEGANPKTFKLLNKSYYTDSEYIYHKHTKVARADLNNLKIYSATTAAVK